MSTTGTDTEVMKFTIRLNSIPSQNLSPEEFTWLAEAAKSARREWNRARRKSDPVEKAMALSRLSAYLFDLEGPQAALGLVRRAHRLWEVAGNPSQIATSRAALAGRLLNAGLSQEALQQSAEARKAMGEMEPQRRHQGIPHCLGREFLKAGHAAEAQNWLELALENPAEGERGTILAKLSSALDLQGKLSEARERQFEACAAFHGQKGLVSMATGMLRLARLELRLGRRWEAMALCQEAATVLERRHLDFEAAECRALYRFCRTGSGEWGSSSESWRSGWNS